MFRMMAVALVATGFAAAARAEGPTVVELYTSQGCSSCPPADALFSDVVRKPGVIGLAFHVDYWDYIGWKDTFGSADFSERQRDYARFAGEDRVYTPQMVINGRQAIVGTDAGALAGALVPVGGAVTPALTVERHGRSLHVTATAPGALPRGARVALVRYIPRAAVSVARGENAGRTLTYTNIVTSWREMGSWDGARPLDRTFDLAGDDPVVVLLQEPGPGPILAAAVVE